MKFHDKRFTVRVGDNKTYRENWKRIFGNRENAKDGVPEKVETEEAREAAARKSDRRVPRR